VTYHPGRLLVQVEATRAGVVVAQPLQAVWNRDVEQPLTDRAIRHPPEMLPVVEQVRKREDGDHRREVLERTGGDLGHGQAPHLHHLHQLPFRPQLLVGVDLDAQAPPRPAVEVRGQELHPPVDGVSPVEDVAQTQHLAPLVRGDGAQVETVADQKDRQQEGRVPGFHSQLAIIRPDDCQGAPDSTGEPWRIGGMIWRTRSRRSDTRCRGKGRTPAGRSCCVASPAATSGRVTSRIERRPAAPSAIPTSWVWMGPGADASRPRERWRRR